MPCRALPSSARSSNDEGTRRYQSFLHGTCADFGLRFADQRGAKRCPLTILQFEHDLSHTTESLPKSNLRLRGNCISGDHHRMGDGFAMLRPRRQPGRRKSTNMLEGPLHKNTRPRCGKPFFPGTTRTAPGRSCAAAPSVQYVTGWAASRCHPRYTRHHATCWRVALARSIQNGLWCIIYCVSQLYGKKAQTSRQSTGERRTGSTTTADPSAAEAQYSIHPGLPRHALPCRFVRRGG